jgi:hypothetical protein
MINLMLNQGTNKWLSKLDDSHSMFSIAVRDGVENLGRTGMEWKRNPHGGRERAIEEVLTTLVWGFGINFIKEKLYDPIVRNYTTVKFPDMDMQIINKAHPQSLSEKVIHDFATKYPEVYGGLEKVVASPNLQKWYHASNVAKFLLCTMVPVAVIALGIPTFNQWLTRMLQTKEKEVAQGPKPPQFASGLPSFKKPSAFQAFEAAQNPNALAGGPVQFGSLGTMAMKGAEAASYFLQNERANTLLVDGSLSSGRFYKGRNWVERLEIAMREATIVFFLFVAQRPVQNFIQKWTDKLFGTHSNIEFDALNHLGKQFKEGGTQAFLNQYQSSRAELVQKLAAKLQNGAAEGAMDVSKLLTDPGAYSKLEKALVEVIRDEALAGKADNVILEIGKACRWIPTINVDGKQMLDLTKTMQNKPFASLIQSLDEVAVKLGQAEGGALQKLLSKSYNGRVGALILANLFCAAFVSYIGPKVQHWITYKLTGKDAFPGIESY